MNESQINVFNNKLAQYKNLIDSLINKQEYSNNTEKAFGEVLSRGGKRIRGALVILGYELAGGLDTKLASQAAEAIEMIHAYLLIIDDIQDKSTLRRGDLSAHKLLEKYHEDNELKGSSKHFGVSMALNSALYGAHKAQLNILSLDTKKSTINHCLKYLNTSLLSTAYGQTLDISAEANPPKHIKDIYKIMDNKTAIYSIQNPLQLGMVLAEATDLQASKVIGFSKFAGRAYQISDDIIGVFGTPGISGKGNKDDLQEGKITLLTHYALNKASAKDKITLSNLLGNELSDHEFNICKEIIVRSKSLDFAKSELNKNIKYAQTELEKNVKLFGPEAGKFLQGFLSTLADRRF